MTMHTNTTYINGASLASPRPIWEKRISRLIDQAHQHKEPYTETFGPHEILVHPSVYSPKYFPETWWYAQHLPPMVAQASFFEVGVGSGLISPSVAAAAAGSFPVCGVDINPKAVVTTRKNFENNQLEGTFVVSDIFDKVEQNRFDFLFWNHPWQIDPAVPEQLKTEKTFDASYQLLRRFVGQAKEPLTDKGAVLLGTSAHANHEAILQIVQTNGYSCRELVRGQESIGEGVVEEYYILELRSH